MARQDYEASEAKGVGIIFRMFDGGCLANGIAISPKEAESGSVVKGMHPFGQSVFLHIRDLM